MTGPPWPTTSPECDVVVCHHVAYNVADIVPFLQRAGRTHARHRVVLELPQLHPLSNLNPLWKQFWDLDRPTRPTADDLAAIARALRLRRAPRGLAATSRGAPASPCPTTSASGSRAIRLCLTEDRDAEVAAALIAQSDAQPRQVATLWWDVSS